MFLVGAPCGFITKAFVVNGNRFELGKVRHLVTPKVVSIRMVEDVMHDTGKSQRRCLLLHWAKPLFHAMAEPVAELTTGPDHKVVDVDKNYTRDMRLLQITSCGVVKEVVIMDTLDQTEVISEEMQQG